MSLSAVECLRRGWTSFAANWELALLCCLQGLLALAFTLLGVVVPLWLLGFDFDAVAANPVFDSPDQALEEFLARLPEMVPALAVGLLALTVFWTLAFLVYSWFQAGIYGTLAVAERRAAGVPPGAALQRQQVRVFSLPAFLEGAKRYGWRFFWFFNLFGVWASLAVLAALLLPVLCLWGIDDWSWGTIFALGCGTALLCGGAMLGLAVWLSVAQADLPFEDSGVWVASRRGWSVLVRRLGAVALLFLLFVAATTALSTAFLPLTLVFDLTLTQSPYLFGVSQIALAVLQSLPNAVLTVVLGGSLMALVRSESQSEQEMYAA